MSLPARLLGANPSIQVSTLLSGSLSTPSAKGEFITTGMFSLATASGSTSTYTFSNIPQTYKSLQIRGIARTGDAGANITVSIRFNDDSGSNYSYNRLESAGAVSVSSGTSQTSCFTLAASGTSAGADIYGSMIVDIYDYTNTAIYKSVKAFETTRNDSAGSGRNELFAHVWNSFAAITKITMSSGTFTSGSQYALYGMK